MILYSHNRIIYLHIRIKGGERMIDTATIPERRKAAGLTKAFMAQLLGIDRHTYADHENRNFWWAHEAAKLDYAFKVIDQGLIRDDDPLQFYLILKLRPVEKLEEVVQSLRNQEKYSSDSFKELFEDITRLIEERKQSERVLT